MKSTKPHHEYLTVVTAIFLPHPDRRLVWHEFSRHAGIWLEIWVSTVIIISILIIVLEILYFKKKKML